MSKTKKIVTIIVLCLVVVIVATTVTLALVPKKYYDAVAGSTDNKADSIAVFSGGRRNEYFYSDEEHKAVCDNIVARYEAGLKENVLLSIFEGTSKFKTSIESYTSTVQLNNSQNTYIQFNYNYSQTLKYNGKEYKDANNNPVTFNSIIVSVTNTSNYMQSVNVYIASDRTNTTATPVVKITTLAKQYKLMEYINTLSLYTA